jgi:phosphoglycolate phosphatase-like HAD superfamily hydrolase
MKVEAIIFDWDGTIVDIDDRELLSVNEALTSIGLKALSRQEFITGYYSTPYTNAGSRMLLRKVLVEEELAEKAAEIHAKEFSRSFELTRLQEAAFNTLKALKQKRILLAVATVRRHKNVVEQEMEYLKVDRFFDVLVTLEDLSIHTQRKQIFSIIADVRAEQFRKALASLGRDRSKAIVVGDGWWDIRGARQAEITSVWVKTGFGLHNDFSKEQPDTTISNLGELLRFV